MDRPSAVDEATSVPAYDAGMHLGWGYLTLHELFAQSP